MNNMRCTWCAKGFSRTDKVARDKEGKPYHSKCLNVQERRKRNRGEFANEKKS